MSTILFDQDRQAGKLGRLAAQRPVGLRDLTHYLKAELAAAPPEVIAPSVPSWGMLGNDKYGDCTIAGMAHTDMAIAAVNKEPLPVFTDAQAEAIYFQLSGGQDSGLVEANVLAYAQSTGLFGPGSKIAGYAPIDHRNADEFRQVIASFGACYTGINVPANAQAQFAAGQPWDLTGTPDDNRSDGGHAVPAVGYSTTGVTFVTWGALQVATWRWLAVNLDEAWALVDSEEPTVDVPALVADLSALGSS